MIPAALVGCGDFFLCVRMVCGILFFVDIGGMALQEKYLLPDCRLGLRRNFNSNGTDNAERILGRIFWRTKILSVHGIGSVVAELK